MCIRDRHGPGEGRRQTSATRSSPGGQRQCPRLRDLPQPRVGRRPPSARLPPARTAAPPPTWGAGTDASARCWVEAIAAPSRRRLPSRRPRRTRQRPWPATTGSAPVTTASSAASRRFGFSPSLSEPVTQSSLLQVVYVEGNRPLAVAALDLTVTGPTGAAVPATTYRQKLQPSQSA